MVLCCGIWHTCEGPRQESWTAKWLWVLEITRCTILHSKHRPVCFVFLLPRAVWNHCLIELHTTERYASWDEAASTHGWGPLVQRSLKQGLLHPAHTVGRISVRLGGLAVWFTETFVFQSTAGKQSAAQRTLIIKMLTEVSPLHNCEPDFRLISFLSFLLVFNFTYWIIWVSTSHSNEFRLIW